MATLVTDVSEHELMRRAVADFLSERCGKFHDVCTRLSPRQAETFDLLGRGIGSKEIALRMGISRKTVEVYYGQLKERFGVRHVSDLYQLAVLGALADAFAKRTA